MTREPIYLENRGAPRALSRPVHRDLQTLLTLIEGQSRVDRFARNVGPRRYQESKQVPVLWEPEADDAPTVLLCRGSIAASPPRYEETPPPARGRGQAVLEFFLAFGVSALMVSAVPAALWVQGAVQGALPHKQANTVAAVPPRPAVSPSSSSPASPVMAPLALSASLPSASTAKMRESVTIRPRAAKVPLRTPKPAASLSPEVGAASTAPPTDSDTTRAAAVSTAAPRTDVARSL
jgi:hypothetical protein